MNVHLMSSGELDAIVVGPDRVASNGDIANKIGTYMVAVLAYRYNIHFYVASPLSTIDMSPAAGANIPIEERSAIEVTGFGETQSAPAGVQIRNPAFDVTPAELVTALITEKSVVHQPNRNKLRELFSITQGSESDVQSCRRFQRIPRKPISCSTSSMLSKSNKYRRNAIGLEEKKRGCSFAMFNSTQLVIFSGHTHF